MSRNKVIASLVCAVAVVVAAACAIAYMLSRDVPAAFGDGRVASAADAVDAEKIHGTPAADEVEVEWYKVHLETPELVDLYDAMKAAMFSLRPGVVVPEMEDEDVKRVFWAVIYDHPEIFWVERNYTFFYNDHDRVVAFDFAYWMDDKEQIESKLHDYEVAADTVLAGASHALPGLYIRTSYLWLGAATKYAEGEQDQNISSVFDERSSVCAGYTQALQFILLRGGVPCARVGGTSNTPDEDGNFDGNHTWLAILNNREILYYDVTWDDISDPGTMDRYFGMSWDRLMEEYVVFDEAAPRNNAERDDVVEMTVVTYEKLNDKYRIYYEPAYSDAFGSIPDTMAVQLARTVDKALHSDE